MSFRRWLRMRGWFKMKIVHISDTHMNHEKVVLPEGDVLVHSGDALNYGSRKELKVFADWWGRLDFKDKIFVPGNHDWAFQKHEEEARDLMHGYVLIHQSMWLHGVKFFGTPFQPVFNDWAFNLNDADRAKKFEEIPKVDVLISHAPPYAICDQLPKGDHVGDKELVRFLPRLPKVLLCGHIHNGYGTGKMLNTGVYNSALCNERYELVNKPQVIEV